MGPMMNVFFNFFTDTFSFALSMLYIGCARSTY